MRSRIRATSAVLATAALVFSSAGTAQADNLYADGDGLSPIRNNDLDFGTVCVGALPATRAIPIAIRRQGNYGNTNDKAQIFKPGSSVTISVDSVTAGLGATVSTPSTIRLPDDWATVATNTFSSSVSSDVGLTTTTPGTFSGAVTYRASGVDADTGAVLTMTDKMMVTATVSDTGTCAPEVKDATPPVITPTVQGTLGNDGWYTSDVTVKWTVVDNESPVTSGPCDDVTVTADTTGTSYTCTATSAGGTATETVTIKRDATKPTFRCAQPSSDWSATDAVIPCTSNDAASGLASTGDRAFDLTTSVASGEETDDALTGYRDISDQAGNTVTAGPIGGNKVDKKAPIIACDSADAVWHSGNVSLGCTASDGGSGLADPADSSFTLATSIADGSETSDAPTGSRAVADAVGNSATAGPITGNKIDRKAPAVSCGGDDGSWHKTNVTIGCTSSDDGSGLADRAEESFALSTTVAEGEETDNASTGSHEVTDMVGNNFTAGPISGIKVDMKAPTLTWSAGAGQNFYFGDQVAAPTCTAVDGGSGLAGECAVSGFDTTVGTHTLTATATDNVGNVGMATLTYTVQAWTLGGFYRPVDMGGVLNTVKAGSTVPLKFNVFKGTERLTSNIGATFSAKQVTCGGSTVQDAMEEFSTTGSTSLRYDSSGQQWIQNWATPKSGAGSCYMVTMTTADGSPLSAVFKLTK